MEYSSFEEYIGRDNKKTTADFDGLFDETISSLNESDITILGDKLYYDNLLSNLNLEAEILSPETLVYKFLSRYNLHYLENLTEIKKQMYTSSGKKVNQFTLTDEPNKLYHVQTGGFGIIFQYNDSIIKIIYDTKYNTREACAEFDIPELIIPYIISSGCDKMISKPLTVIHNLDLQFITDIYKNYCTLIALFYNLFKGIKIEPDAHLHFNHKDTSMKYEEMKNWKIFKFCIKTLYQVLVSESIIINRNLSNIIYYFSRKEHKDLSNIGSIIIFPKAIASIDNLTWCETSKKIKLNLEKSMEKNLFNTHPKYLREFFLQLCILFHNIYQKFPTFLHYDLKLNNILLEPNKMFYLKIMEPNNSIQIFCFNSGYMIKLHDFDFSSIPGTYTNVKFPRIANLDTTKCNWFFEFKKLVINLINNFRFVSSRDPEFTKFLISNFEISDELVGVNVKINMKDKNVKRKSIDELRELIMNPLFDEYRLNFD
ncbi:serine-threonine kinase [Carp edema virus]|nr:serine-threonine kinase [Carp edema virus]